MKWTVIFLFILSSSFLSAQDEDLQWLKTNQVDSLYREDQFYLGFTFNFLTQLPEAIEQSGFSGGLNFGFIRDMPINTRRNLALGLGLGFNINTFGQTLRINTGADDTQFFPISEDVNYDINRFNTHYIELPLELRWRSSDVDKNAFWRVYLGVHLGYLFHFKSNYSSQNQTLTSTDKSLLNPFTTSIKLTFGYGAINFMVNANLTPLFNDQQINSTGESINIQPIKAGLVFYFL